MKTLWILTWITSLTNVPTAGIDGKHFATLNDCRTYAMERIAKIDLSHDRLEWWCSTIQHNPVNGAFEIKAKEH